MKRHIAYAGLWVSLLTIFFGIGAPIALAATSNSTSTTNTSGTGQALEIAPPLLTLTANPGQTVKATLQLRDVAKTDLIVTNEVNDFVASGESGTPKILTKDDPSNPFTLKSWITALPSFQMSPGKIQTLNVSINVPANASPGGHYGVIRFTGTPPKLEGTGVSLSASLGALVLLTVNGKLTHKLSVEQFAASSDGTNTKSLFEATPVTFIVRLKNTGNVQEEPTGNIMVTDMFGKTVGGVNINVPPHNVLPSSIRKFTPVLDKTVLGNKHLFGRYHADLNVSYGGGKQTVLTDHITFWVIPYKLIVGVIIVLVAAFFALRFGLRRYNQAIINRAQGGKPSGKKSSKK